MIKTVTYQQDIDNALNQMLPWEKLNDSCVLIVGATGMIGTCLIDILMHAASRRLHNIKVIAMARDESRICQRFHAYLNRSEFFYVATDVNKTLDLHQYCVDYIIFAAGNTHPVAYASDPISTILTNIIGLKNVLDFAHAGRNVKSVFLSSVEIYGQDRGDTEDFHEKYCGYIDCNTLRAGYPEGKRAGEALCQAYREQYGMHIVIARLSRMYGSTVLEEDSKVISQFIRRAQEGKDILLKSDGMQEYSFTYAIDGAVAVLFLLLAGKDGEAYNVADRNSEMKLHEVAEIVAGYIDKSVVFEAPNQTEQKGFSNSVKGKMNTQKLEKLGWVPQTNIKEGLIKTLESALSSK